MRAKHAARPLRLQAGQHQGQHPVFALVAFDAYQAPLGLNVEHGRRQQIEERGQAILRERRLLHRAAHRVQPGRVPELIAPIQVGAPGLTLLARRVAAGQIADPLAERHAVEDMWKDPLINRRWQRLALRLTAEDCERIGRVAAERGLAGSGVLWLKDEAATEGWALGSGGYAVEGVGKVAAVDCPPRLASAAFGPAMGQGAWRDGNGVARFAQAVNDR